MAAPTQLASFVIEHYKALDYIPLVSTAINLVYLFQKTIGHRHSIGILRPSDRFWTHLESKSFTRCVVLLIPVLGNIAVGITDFMENKIKQQLMVAIGKDPLAFTNAPDYLQRDEDVRSAAAAAFLATPEKLKDAWGKLHWLPNVKWQFHKRIDIARAALRGGAPVCLQEVDKSLCDDKNFALPIVQRSGRELQFASKRLRADRDVIFAAVCQDEWALLDAGEALSANKAFIIDLIKTTKRFPCSIDEALSSDPDLVFEAACCVDGFCLETEFTKNEEFILRLMKVDERHFRKSDCSLRKKPDFMLKAMAIVKQGWHFAGLDDSLAKNGEFILEAMRARKVFGEDQCQGAFCRGDRSLRENRDFMLSAIEIYAGVFSYAARSLEEDAGFLREALRRNPELAKDIRFMRQAIDKRVATLVDAHISISAELKADLDRELQRL